MNKNINNEEFVSQYLDNELSEFDRLDFENKLLKDADLKEEYNFQKEIVNGIKEVRRLQLKSRLSNVTIPSPIYQTIGFKLLTAATISAGIGVGIYFLANDDNELGISTIDLKDNNTEIAQQKDVIPEIPKTIIPIIKEKTADRKKKNKPKDSTEEVVVARRKAEKSESKAIEPNVIQPDVIAPVEEEDFESNEINIDQQTNNLDNIKENMESAVAVSTVKDKKNNFHYKFFENKLFLLGNFNDMPYEIIELNSSKGKSYFLFYDDSYYKLNTGQLKPAPLVKIENDSLVNELKIIQMKQSD